MSSEDMLLVMIKWVGIYLLVGINVVLIRKDTWIKEIADGVSERVPFDYKIVYGMVVMIFMIFWLPFAILDIGTDIKFAIEDRLGVDEDEDIEEEADKEEDIEK
ncbi:hypothetical protein [Bacillus mycoides]|uniref:hypothetical protein n=1 Tax=Bacillus mycoides TaxID=1405 RepID=UPI003A7FD42C